MNENKTRKPIILSMPVIILVSIISFTILAPVSIIMSIVRFKRYPELKNKNIACLFISCVMMVLLIMFFNMPDGGKEITTAEVNNKEVTKVEETVEEPEVLEPIETPTEETTKEEVEDTGVYGYPEQEKELADAGVDVTTIPSRECFLYTYAEFKALADHMDLKDMDAIETEVWNYVSDADSMTDYEMIDTVVFSYAGDNLANYIPDYLVPLVGDECNDVVDSAMATYYGYTPEGSASTNNAVTIDYIEALENSNSIRLSIAKQGFKTKEEIYNNASEIASNISTTEFTNCTKDFVRDLDNYVGKPVMYSGMVNSTTDNNAEVMNGESDVIVVELDLSYVDTTLLSQDNVTVYGVYLGLNNSDTPVILALSVNIN